MDESWNDRRVCQLTMDDSLSFVTSEDTYPETYLLFLDCLEC